MGVYQRRENLRFYGIEEDPEGAEHTWQVLMDFVQPGLSIDDASDIEFQRVHRIGPFNQQAPKPRQIIARFLHYPDRERVMSNARKLKFRKFGISATCLKKSLIDGREKVLPKFFAAKKAGKSAYLVGRSPIYFLLMENYFLLSLASQTMFFFLNSLPILNCNGTAKLIYVVCIYHSSRTTFSVGSLIIMEKNAYTLPFVSLQSYPVTNNAS